MMEPAESEWYCIVQPTPSRVVCKRLWFAVNRLYSISTSFSGNGGIKSSLDDSVRFETYFHKLEALLF